MSLPITRIFTVRRVAVTLLLGSLLVTACSARQAADADLPSIVVTTTILGDLVRNVVEDGAEVEVLLPNGADPHDYQASPRQVATMAEADLVVTNGLGLEAGMGDILTELAAEGVNVLELGPLLDPVPLADNPDRLDPHVWLDPIRMADAVLVIAAELSDEFPSVDWGARADHYAERLRAADDEIRAILEKVPDGKRTLITNHESLAYFAGRYGFVVVATVIPGGSTLAEPSSAELAALVAVIDDAQVPAIFAETTAPDSLARAVAAEAEREVAVVELFTESLGEPGSGAENLIEMLILDARLIADSLTSATGH